LNIGCLEPGRKPAVTRKRHDFRAAMSRAEEQLL
jgi:hypothetical protein